MSDSDRSLIQQIKNNDESAIEELIARYGQYTAAIVYGVGGASMNAEDVEEVVSDVFYAIWKSRHSLQQTDSIKPYLAQIARNMTRNKWSRVRNEQPLDDELSVIGAPATDEVVILKERISMIKTLMAAFKYPDKDILTAYYFREYKLEDIASMYELPLSTVKSKIYRGKKSIVQYFDKGGCEVDEYKR
ncbi:sigma-70 family RNA polymerase sigma factor [Paenibacillus sp. PR3]|uniref:Sigma-70 family RNA polymerase sigma factor n=1 Tax=Paenibacillus terricola TaxID=2763503 RepID=A0ABR8MN31_9BACL|nr:sigma-70 family RNA polymerase sigma factor [Paenibacillus terricola]MBD3917426.1 sigma-70 family RNA polymerase sigma factor [Paenibacillus terricola]